MFGGTAAGRAIFLQASRRGFRDMNGTIRPIPGDRAISINATGFAAS
jgi:hypothetical protein